VCVCVVARATKTNQESVHEGRPFKSDDGVYVYIINKTRRRQVTGFNSVIHGTDVLQVAAAVL